MGMAVGCTRKGISSQKRAVRYLHMLTHLSDPYISVDLGVQGLQKSLELAGWSVWKLAPRTLEA